MANYGKVTEPNMLNILQWLTLRLNPAVVERRCGHERRQQLDRRSEPRTGQQQSSRRHHQRRQACTALGS